MGKNKLKILSLFDGISCGRVALERAGFEVDKYYASETDKYAIKIAQKNYPDTVQLGDVTNWIEWKDKLDWSKIDLIQGGSPCQGFSFAGKQLNFADKRSALFFIFENIVAHAKKHNPNVKFLLENVRMKQEYQDVISERMGVKPIMINSNLVSAQNRVRLYWTNIPNIKQPEDKNIMLKDIVHENCDDRYLLSRNAVKRLNNNGQGYHSKINPKKGSCLFASMYKTSRGIDMMFETLAEYIVPFDKTLKILEKEIEKGKVGYFRKDSQANRVYYIHDKAITLCGEAGGGAAKMGQYLFGCITPDRIDKRQNG